MQQQITNLAKRLLPFSLRLRLRKANWQRMYRQQRKHIPAGSPAVFCPIAAQEFECFIEHKGHKLSPGNGAKARHRLIWLYLRRQTDLFERPQRLLHIAPEVCLMPAFRQNQQLEYVPVDKFVDGYGAQDGVIPFDLLDAPFPDGHFDFIVCNHVLEHIPDDARAMKEMRRLCSEGATVLITVPIDESRSETYEDPSIISPEDRARHYGQWDHVRFYAPDIADRLRKAGFSSVELIRYAEQFNRSDYHRYGLNDDLLVIARP